MQAIDLASNFASLPLVLLLSVSLFAVAWLETSSTSRWRGGFPSLVWSLGVLAAFLFCHFGAGEESRVTLFDNLEGPLPVYVLLSKLPVFGAIDPAVPGLLDALPKNSLPSQLNLYAVVFRWLPPFAAFATHDAVVRLVALGGIWLLLRRHALPGGERWVAAGVSTAFALLPFLAAASLSIAGLPVLLCALLDLRRGVSSASRWTVIALFPFGSMLPLIGWVAVALVVGVACWDGLRSRRLPVRLLLAAFLLVAGYAIAEYGLLHQLFLEPGYRSQRTEFAAFLVLSRNLGGLAVSVREHFLHGFPHAASLHWPVLLGGVGAALAIGVARAAGARFSGSSGAPSGAPGVAGLASRLGRILIAIALLSIVFALDFHEPFQSRQFASPIGAFRTLRISRIAWFEPVLWYLGYAVALELLRRSLGWGRALAAVLLALQIAFVFPRDEFYAARDSLRVSFRGFYSPELFGEIEARIGGPASRHRVVSLGLPPAIATYNGFHSMDAYLGNYPLEYKRRFRRLIAAELERSALLRRFFDLWGSKCYLFAAELAEPTLDPHFPGFLKTDPIRRIRRLQLDRQALQDLRIDYLLSAVEIETPGESGLSLRGVFEREDSPWQIFLYAPDHGPVPPGGARSTSSSVTSRMR